MRMASEPQISRILLTSGKLYYELAARKIRTTAMTSRSCG